MKNLKSKSKEKRCTLKKKTDQRPFYILKSPEIETKTGRVWSFYRLRNHKSTDGEKRSTLEESDVT